MKKLIALLALGAAYYFVQAKSFLKTYKVKFLSAKLDSGKTRDSNYSKIFFTIKMLVTNKTGFAGTLQSGYVSVSYKGKVVGSSQSKEPITIGKEEETLIRIPAAIDSLKLIGSVPEMFAILTQSKELKFHLDGELKFKIGNYKINQDYKVQI